MAARQPVGASNRADLFRGGGQGGPPHFNGGRHSPAIPGAVAQGGYGGPGGGPPYMQGGRQPSQGGEQYGAPSFNQGQNQRPQGGGQYGAPSFNQAQSHPPQSGRSSLNWQQPPPQQSGRRGSTPEYGGGGAPYGEPRQDSLRYREAGSPMSGRPETGASQPPSTADGGTGSNMLELEHIIGYTGHYLHTVCAHPRDANVILKSMGAIMVVADVTDPHRQTLLRGHDMEITAFAISLSGRLLATGQAGSAHHKGFRAPVIVWDYASSRPVYTLDGITESVVKLAFSPDERFLLGAGQDCLLYVWDLQTGEVAFGKRFPKPVKVAQWCGMDTSARRPVYQVCICHTMSMLAMEFAFDPVRRQWQLQGDTMSMPASGLVRDYNASALTSGGEFMVCGTSVGDLCVYRLGSKVFRASIPVCSGGLLSICADPRTGVVFCGGGDGTVKRVSGTDMHWRLDCQGVLDGPVVSLSMQADGTELIAGTGNGSVFRVLAGDLSAIKVSASHTAPISQLAMGPRNDSFASVSGDGTVRVWDLGDYSVLSEVTERGGGGALCVCWLGDKAVITGWGEGFLRCYDAGTCQRAWEIPKAHRGAVTTVAAHTGDGHAFLLSGSDDGSVRVWSLRTRELMMQFVEHQKPVSTVLVDVKSSHLVHSAAQDCAVFTYDLQKQRRVVAHMTRTGAFLGMTQRLDSEQELVTCDVNGRLLMWDCDVRDPVQTLQDPSNKKVLCASVSPSGRFLATCGEDQMVKVVDLQGGNALVACGRGHSEPVTTVQWTPDERQLISAGKDCTVCVWNFYDS